MRLTPAQLTAIDQHLRKENWLLNEDLISELTDHYINGITDRMAQGMAFDPALREIHTGFGGRKGLLKMEEEYQVQKARQVDVYIWREIRLFFEQTRIAITLALFAFVYWLNAFSGVTDSVDAFFSVGLFMMTASIFAPVLAAILFFTIKPRQVNKIMLWPTTISFYILYSIGLVLKLTATYAPSMSQMMSATFKLWGSSLVETLMVIYMIATVIGLRKLFRNNPKIA